LLSKPFIFIKNRPSLVNERLRLQRVADSAKCGFYKRFERLFYWSYSLSACRCCSCWSAVSALVLLWSTLAFIGDATACPLGNSSVPMKLSTGRKLTEGKEDNALSWTTFLRLPLSLRLFSLCFFLDRPVAFSSSFIRETHFCKKIEKDLFDTLAWISYVNFAWR